MTCQSAQPPTVEPARLCESCLLTRPIADFRRRRATAGQRMRQCRQCHNAAERCRRAALRSKSSKRQMALHLGRLRDAASANRVRALCGEMVLGYGGAEGFANAWRACLQRDLERGGFAALRHLEATIRLIQHCEQNRPDYSQWTDDELRGAISAFES